MPDIAPSAAAPAVLAHLVATLAAATIAGVPVFAGGVSAYEDEQDFDDRADPLKGDQAGVTAVAPERRYADESTTYAYRIRAQVLVRFTPAEDAAPGAGDNGMSRFLGLAAAVEAALTADRSRGGLAEGITWGGQYVPGTEVGEVALLPPKGGVRAFLTGRVPVVVVWGSDAAG